jgi:hypothetical protein
MNSAATQPNLLELAKQGNANAIAALINRQLQTKGITAKAALKNGCLQVVLESAQAPNQQALVEFIRKGITNISPKSIERVKIHRKQINTSSPLWSIEFEIDAEENQNNTLDKTEEKTDSSFSEPKTTENSKEKPRQTSFVLESTGNKQLDIILKKTAIVLISAILIVSGWRIGQATGFLSFDTASAPSITTAPPSSDTAPAPSTTTANLASVTAGATIVKGTKNFISVVGLATHTPMVTLLLPRTEWDSLDEKGKENVKAYTKSLIPLVRANPIAYVDIPPTAPIYEEFVRKTKSVCTDCWQVEVGQPSESGSLMMDETVARGQG